MKRMIGLNNTMPPASIPGVSPYGCIDHVVGRGYEPFTQLGPYFQEKPPAPVPQVQTVGTRMKSPMAINVADIIGAWEAPLTAILVTVRRQDKQFPRGPIDTALLT
jgi:hypothetical protein